MNGWVFIIFEFCVRFIHDEKDWWYISFYQLDAKPAKKYNPILRTIDQHQYFIDIQDKPHVAYQSFLVPAMGLLQ